MERKSKKRMQHYIGDENQIQKALLRERKIDMDTY